jgi:hypothetical protein
MGASFELSGYVFRDMGISPGMFVNDTAGERGLQFKKAGISVTLPAPVRSVDLRLGAFSGTMTVSAKNLAGAVIATQTVPALNKFMDIRMVGSEIATLELTDGGDEGILIRICSSLSICGARRK